MERIKNLISKIKELIPRGIKMYNDSKVSVYSGYATLFIVTSMFPCIILIISIVNLLPGYSTKDVAEILFQILPDLGSIKDLIVGMMENLKDQSGGLLASAAAVTTLWAASKGVLSIQQGLDQLDSAALAAKKEEPENGGLAEKGKGYIKGVLKRLVFTLTIIILIPALLVFQMLGDSIASVIKSAIDKLGLETPPESIDSFFNITMLVVILFALLVILQIFAKLPAKHRILKSQIPGAILTGVCWLAFTDLFSFFIPRFYHASSLYGSLASLFLMLLWLRYMVVILFAGGILNRVLEEQKRERAETDAPAQTE